MLPIFTMKQSIWFPLEFGRRKGSAMFPKLSSLSLVLVALLCFAQSNGSQPSVPSTATPSASNPTSLTGPSRSESSQPASATSPAAVPSMPNPLGEAMALYRQGKLDGALAKYQQLLQQQRPQSPDAYAGIIRVYLKQNKVDEAARVADQALALSDAARIRVAHAELLFRQGKIEDAEREWVDVIKSGHPEARAYLGLARVRRAIAMYKASQDFIQKAHDLDPYDPDIEERWVSTLPRSERIKYLERALNGENNWDAERRAATATYLDYLKEREKKKYSPCHLVVHPSKLDTWGRV
jgi:tetratricopeptide (TPR) repeat protein